MTAKQSIELCTLSRAHVERRLNATGKIDLPFPHLYIDDFITGEFKALLRASFDESAFTTAPGGCPVSNITASSTANLRWFREEFLFNYLIPRMDGIFKKEIDEKQRELSKNYPAVKQLQRPEAGYLHLTRNHKGTTVNSHRDDDRATYQFVIYLGDESDRGVSTTELIFVEDIDDLERTQDYSRLRLLSYGRTNNAILVFANQPHSYHCLSKPTGSERLTVAGSVIHYQTE